ncbi:flagellar hook-length control protein FliK [Halomonas sp. SBBP1]|nr:flagellar hook-length control protein FliK [Halomonas sp. SBBP1]
MRPEAPLVSSQETPTASAVATRLEASIRDSGLFYESHLKRWFQGEGTRQQLMNQPQMQPGPRSLAALLPTSLSGAPSAQAPPASAPPSTAASSVAVSTAAPSAGSPAALASAPLAPLAAPPVVQGVGMTILPNVPLIPVAHEQGLAARLAGGGPHFVATGSTAASATTTQAPAVASPVSSNPAQAGSVATPAEVRDGHQARAEISQAREVAELMAHRPAREVVHESLQSLVRQQLEMLVMPTIRWEGDVWAGIFMALVINLPAREEGAEGKEKEGEQDGGWRSDMQLDVPNLGAFNASLWLYRNVLSIDFTTDSTEVYQRIDAGLPALEKRLSALDLQKVQLRARHIEAEAAYGNAG